MIIDSQNNKEQWKKLLIQWQRHCRKTHQHDHEVHRKFPGGIFVEVCPILHEKFGVKLLYKHRNGVPYFEVVDKETYLIAKLSLL